ncbi:MFS general substrate transporter [Periconia macrospinosa]|uniref:MFS general substrate transporter n=1 Tax=Periconia macrospinosa TaxID=97972 RepID=A0A2V1D6Z1_9PLEO|nr:MFS general substrate transporter [Periconia macrospinosa]
MSLATQNDSAQVSADDIELRPSAAESEQSTNDVVADSKDSDLTKTNILKLIAAGFAYFFAGANDGSLGALTPYILHTYGIGTEYIALIYASTFIGWIAAAVTNSHVSQYLDLGAILTVGSLIQLSAHLLRFWNPPFGLYVVTFFIQALGMGYQDSHGNTFVASIKGAHRWLGMIHAMYALGSLVSPFVATPLAARLSPHSDSSGRWTLFYLFLVGIGSINALATAWTFRDTLKLRRKPEVTAGADQTKSRSKTATRAIMDTLKSPPVYLLSMFYFFMLGVGITAGGWVVEYLVSARAGRLPDVGYVPSGLWGGIFLGRVFLAEPTHRFGERRMTMGYCVLILALQLIFWLIPNIVSSAVAISLLGFFFGPMFATGMSIATKLFPKQIQPTALGFVFVLAQAGGALFPAITGVVASKAGVKVLQPMLVGLIVAMSVAWALVPKVKTRAE